MVKEMRGKQYHYIQVGDAAVCVDLVLNPQVEHINHGMVYRPRTGCKEVRSTTCMCTAFWQVNVNSCI